MVNYKTVLKITYKGEKYSLDRGMNRANSADYIYILYKGKENELISTVAIQNIKTGKITMGVMEDVPFLVAEKIKNHIFSLDRALNY